MKLASILVPAYLPRAHASATPTPYTSGLVDKFERELAQMVPMVIRHFNSARLTPDTNGRFVSQEILTRYDLAVDDTAALADAIALALKTFSLAKVTVIFDDADTQDFTTDTVAELHEGLHEWSGD